MSKKAEQSEEQPLVLDTSTDREQGLSQNFPDAVFDIITLDAEEGGAAALVNETAEAVHELIGGATGTNIPAYTADGEYQLELGGELQSPSLASLTTLESPNLSAKWEMANKLFQFVMCEKSFADLVEGALLVLMRAVQAQAGSVLEIDRERQEFFFRASVGGGDPEKVKTFRVPCNKGLVGQVAETRAPLLLRDLDSDQVQLRAISASTGFDARTCIAAPILVGGELFGVVEIFNKNGDAVFSEKDLETLVEGVQMITKILEVRFLMAELVRRQR